MYTEQSSHELKISINALSLPLNVSRDYCFMFWLIDKEKSLARTVCIHWIIYMTRISLILCLAIKNCTAFRCQSRGFSNILAYFSLRVSFKQVHRWRKNKVKHSTPMLYLISVSHRCLTCDVPKS